MGVEGVLSIGSVVAKVCSCLIRGCCWKASNAASPLVESGGVSSKDVPWSASG